MGVDELTGYLMLFVGETKKLMKLRQNEKALELARRSADMMHGRLSIFVSLLQTMVLASRASGSLFGHPNP